MEIRNTTQYLMPFSKNGYNVSGCDIYPAYKLPDDRIRIDYKSLAVYLSGHKQVIIDGYIGVFFESIKSRLNTAFEELNLRVNRVNFGDAVKAEVAIEELIRPFMGEEDLIFGTRASIALSDYFDEGKIKKLKQDPGAGLNIIYGAGAQLAGWDGLLVYIDLPKNELQFRARAKSITNLGARQPFDMMNMYKRYYFIDWVRPDLNGFPRTLNIKHGMNNLCFDRKGEKVRKEFISSPGEVRSGPGWKMVELPTHDKHTYRVHRYHFKKEVHIETGNIFNVLSLVEGSSISVITEKGIAQTFHYAETFVVPAATGEYTIRNNADSEAIVVVTFMK